MTARTKTQINAAWIDGAVVGPSGSANTTDLWDSILFVGGEQAGAATSAQTFTQGIITPSIYGGTAANADLTLEGTSSSTKDTSYVILQPTSGNVGIGTTGPASLLHVLAPSGDTFVTIGSIGSNAVLNARAGMVINLDSTGVYADITSFQINKNIADVGGTNLFTVQESGNVGIGTTGPATLLETENITTLTSASADAYSATITLDPGYTAASAFAVTRHNYFDIQNPSVAGAGPAAVTDACVFRFDSDAATHKCLSGSTAKASASTVNTWVKINVSGSLLYIPAYSSTTA